MARKIIQDIVPGKKKKLETPVPIKIIKKEEVVDKTESDTNKVNPFLQRKSPSSLGLFNEDKKRDIPFPKLPKRKGERFWEKQPFWWSLGGVVVIVGGIFFTSVYFSKANIEVILGKATVPISISLNAKKSASTGIPFEIIMTKGAETKPVNATGTKNVSTKASGQVVIYNDYSSATQKLIQGTRLVASNGKTYRIQSGIVVPGKSGGVPGSIEVTVYADQAGADYNIGLSDFTIPGFKGDPRYDKFYGRSKTDIVGGFSGAMPVASDKDIADAKVSIEESLREDLLRDASSQVPDGYVLYKDAVRISFEDTKDQGNDPKIVTLGENGTLVGILLKKDSISNEVAKEITTVKKDIPTFTVDSIDGLTFSFASNTPALDDQAKEISFSLSGKADVTYTIDITALKNDLTGEAKADFPSLLSKYSSVKSARIASFVPFWAGYFPVESEKISITIAK